jgi:hypothetical protein
VLTHSTLFRACAAQPPRLGLWKDLVKPIGFAGAVSAGAFGWALLRDEDAARRQRTDPLKSALDDFLQSRGVHVERRLEPLSAEMDVDTRLMGHFTNVDAACQTTSARKPTTRTSMSLGSRARDGEPATGNTEGFLLGSVVRYGLGFSLSQQAASSMLDGSSISTGLWPNAGYKVRCRSVAMVT